MKVMFKFIEEINSRLMASLEEEARNGQPVELRDKFGKYSMDTIASCAFGMDAESFTNEKSQFVRNASKQFE